MMLWIAVAAWAIGAIVWHAQLAKASVMVGEPDPGVERAYRVLLVVLALIWPLWVVPATLVILAVSALGRRR